MNQYIRILLIFPLFTLVMNSGISQSLQLSNRTKTALTFLIPLTEAEMSTPLHLGDLRQRNILKAPLANGAQLPLNIKRPDQSMPNLLAISESDPGSFENTFTYFMLYNVSGSKIALEEQHRIGSEQFGSMSETEPAQFNIQNKTELPIYSLALRWEQADGTQEKALLKPWQVIPAGKETVLGTGSE
ncbi:hypothetical protein [Haliscomenobacter hydrossis]|uniref:Uncharacterized protein n=1 Tax=Haliscomenobacter hydrossis (strain ATCC 27775 / DSM 1100 / LMG 10767 / O) TaxID=760192 RepID=F4L2D1_HALH1|nr:hypothetical protein [Haliscomenobacter hydrossis]AEE52884.1 hypothetical protein Halhy_5058 [Haliscomenobacter hydrossis DSM 1100]